MRDKKLLVNDEKMMKSKYEKGLSVSRQSPYHQNRYTLNR